MEAGENGEPFDIHFGNQKSPIFLLNESENRAALFFASSSDASVLLEMQKRHRDKVKRIKSDEKRLRAEVETLDSRLLSFEHLGSIAASTEGAEEQYQELLETVDRITALETDIGILASTTTQHDELVSDSRHLASLSPPPELSDSPTLASLLQIFAAGERAFQADGARSHVLSDLKQKPDVADVSKLETVIGSLVIAEQTTSRRRDRSSILNTVLRPPVQIDVRALESLCQRLVPAKEKHDALVARSESLDHLRQPVIIGGTEVLHRIACDLESALQRYLSLKQARFWPCIFSQRLFVGVRTTIRRAEWPPFNSV